MPPNPDIPFSSSVPKRRFSSSSIPRPVYLGLDVHLKEEERTAYYSISVHDGSFTTDYFSGVLLKYDGDDDLTNNHENMKNLLTKAVEELKNIVKLYVTSQQYKVQIIAISYYLYRVFSVNELPKHTVMSGFWKELDAIPFRVHSDAKSSDERASACVRKAVMWLSPQYPGNIPRVCVGYRLDFNNTIHLVDLADYEETVQLDTWRVWNEVTKEFKEKKLKVAYFNSTPQGGGVALMRHALLRFFSLNDIKAHWYVSRPKPEIFDITKHKFHNVLQGVAPPDVRLTEEDKENFISWSNENAERFWLDKDGPILNSDVIVIDDPQLSGIIPHIKKHSPSTRIIYRSHIEIRSDLIREDPNSPQATTWKFLWNFIKHADLFIAHPMESFIPDDVPRSNVVLLPACTDPLDGLNKELTHWCITYYRSIFNRICMDQGANEVEWDRPYIIQVARFDPSKGIPDVLESYRLLREKMANDNILENIPQLVICGHGSIDDPDGTHIYNETYQTITSDDKYRSILQDIIVVQIQPSDQLLNMILRGAYVALQLSHREGFEVKVTEAFQKGVPVIAYEAGGIPLQVIHDQTGYLVPIGNTDLVAHHLYQLFTHPDLRQSLSLNALNYLTEEYFTVWNAISWIFMFNQLSSNHLTENEKDVVATTNDDDNGGLLDHSIKKKILNHGLGNTRYVRSFWHEKYHFNPPKSFIDHSLLKK